MSLLFIHAQNSNFHACDDGAEYDQPEMALAMGLRSALALIAEEVNQGETSAAIEVSVERANGTQLLRSVVAISVSSLMPAPRLSKLLAE
ncbi:MAG: hypothetical protein ACRYF2_03315 [Janthinobacterium lividum]